MAGKSAGISSDAVLKATGKSWDEWFALLDKAGGKQLAHKDIVAVLSDHHGVGSWWQQMVTVGYEQSRGLRVKHQTAKGFSVSRSKTLAMSIADVFTAWKDKRKRAKWLADPEFTIRTATPNRSLRISWVDGASSVDVMLYDKGLDKCQVTVEHSKLANETEATKMKAYWGEQLDALAAIAQKAPTSRRRASVGVD